MKSDVTDLEKIRRDDEMVTKLAQERNRAAAEKLERELLEGKG